MQHAKFTRKKEDFICEVCGLKVHGNGYTNHCPRCLSSKHMDIHPGDRACSCKGIMLATGFELKNGVEYIIHTCQSCGYQRANKVNPSDERDAVIALSCKNMTSYLATLKPYKK